MGRKSIAGEPMCHASIKMLGSDMDRVAKLGNGNLSAGLRIVVAHYFNNRRAGSVASPTLRTVAVKPRGFDSWSLAEREKWELEH